MSDQEEIIDDCEPEPISDELNALVCATIDYALDLLGETAELSVTLVVEDAAGNQVLLSFDDEEIEECLDEARSMVASKSSSLGELEGRPVRYAIAYDGAVEESQGAGYEPALIVEYGEKGLSQGYSAFLFYLNAGEPDRFQWTDPAAAGICDLLV